MNISFLKEKGNKGIVYVLLGALVLLLLIPSTAAKNETITETDVSDQSMEERLQQVLSSMEGVGKVEVMITLEGSGSTLFGTEGGKQKVCGVLVVAEGAGNAAVNARISEAVKALFSIDLHKISIAKMKSQEEKR